MTNDWISLNLYRVVVLMTSWDRGMSNCVRDATALRGWY
jgi:hypothetical protein